MRIPRSDNLFCYGTLEFPQVMHAVAGRIYPRGNAVLHGFARYMVRGELYPGVIAQPDAEVHGVLYRKIDPEGLRRIDHYESDFYGRELLEVEKETGERAAAWVYVVPDSLRKRLDNRDWDREAFAHQHLRAWLRSMGGRL